MVERHAKRSVADQIVWPNDIRQTIDRAGNAGHGAKINAIGRRKIIRGVGEHVGLRIVLSHRARVTVREIGPGFFRTWSSRALHAHGHALRLRKFVDPEIKVGSDSVAKDRENRLSGADDVASQVKWADHV